MEQTQPTPETAPIVMTTYSCRAEEHRDALRFLNRLTAKSYRSLDGTRPVFCALHLWNDFAEEHNGCQFEFRTNLDRVGVLRVMRADPDWHVMRETLRAVPLAKNSLERIYER